MKAGIRLPTTMINITAGAHQKIIQRSREI
jgi:hypothetical protein